MSENSVRLAVEADVPSIAALLADFRDSLGKDVPTREQIQSSVETILSQPSSEFLIARNDAGEPAGVAQVRYRWSVWTGAEDCWLEDLFVRAGDRGTGLGRALVASVVAQARMRGCRRIELDVDEGNSAALALYESVGFSSESKGHGRSLLMGLPIR